MKTVIVISIVMLCISFNSQAQRRTECFTYPEVVKISNYIQELETKDNLNAIKIKKYEAEISELKAQINALTNNTKDTEPDFSQDFLYREDKNEE